MTDTNNPLAIVQTMFGAFGAGNLDALIDTVHPESRWVYYGANPRLSKKVYAGKAEVRQFFEGIVERLAITAFNTDEFLVDGDTVVIFGSESGTVKATGQPFHHVWSQKYVVKDNLITEMAEYNLLVES
ncbi:MAG: nuclear transport factor 2 family protein [Anaerolineae bacterium]|nr:nuclear transport factor 2 family protein [Anaerolineae bacterium]